MEDGGWSKTPPALQSSPKQGKEEEAKAKSQISNLELTNLANNHQPLVRSGKFPDGGWWRMEDGGGWWRMEDGALAKREGGKAVGEKDWKDYLFAVRQSPRGLKERLNLDYRIELLESLVSNDRQALSISHLAKTLALKGEEQKAMYWLGA